MDAPAAFTKRWTQFAFFYLCIIKSIFMDAPAAFTKRGTPCPLLHTQIAESDKFLPLEIVE